MFHLALFFLLYNLLSSPRAHAREPLIPQNGHLVCDH